MLRALTDFRRTWPQLIVTDLLARAITVVVLTPLVALLLGLFLRRTEDQVLTDTDIAAFLLHPIGITALVVVGGVTLGIFFARASLVMVIGHGAAEDRRVTYVDALKYVLARASGFGPLAVHVLVRVLLVSLPFLAALGAVYLFLLRQHDINYFLTEKPPEFLRALFLGGLILGALAMLLLQMTAAWILALPLFLFEGVRGTEALRRSKEVTAGSMRRITAFLAGWLAVISVVSMLASYAVGRLGGFLIPEFDPSGNFALAALGLGTTLLLAGLLNLSLQMASDSLLPLVIVRMYRSLTGPGELTPAIAERGSLGEKPTLKLPGKALLGGSAAALVLTVVLAYVAARSIDPEKHAEIIAHRGASSAAPENTMAAFERAAEDGSDWIELDVQENADGEVIVAHDSDFMKQARVGTKVWEATNEDLLGIDIGSWFHHTYADQRVPTLREVLEWAKGRIRVLIELKYYGHDEALEARVAELVEETGMVPEISVMSLSRGGLQKLAELRPDWPRGLLNVASVGDLTRVDVDYLALNTKAATRAQIRQAHARGMKVYVWTVNDPLQMSVMLSRGADGIITDEPALARAALELREELSPLGHLVLWVAGETGLLRSAEESSEVGDA